MSTQNELYWRRKLSAYLHDSPDKVIELSGHAKRARSLAQREGFQAEENARKTSDHAASAADRLPWPKSAFCRSGFDATDRAIQHPLGQGQFDFPEGFKSAGQGLDVAHKTKPAIADDDPRAAFITLWRFWENWASSADSRFAFLPAETRLPDHTIWNHLAVTSALQGCYGGSQKEWQETKEKRLAPPPPDKPAFLLFSIGPVQDFIAAARSTRDLWSGSYLLSYLVGTALKHIALDFGPDHVLFPNLLNQPILDLLLKSDLWDHVTAANGENLWQAFGYYDAEGKSRLLTPGLPNRFLTILPSEMAEHPQWKAKGGAVGYANHLEEKVHGMLRKIAESVAQKLETLGEVFDRSRFIDQVDRIFEIRWQVLPWPNSAEDARDLVTLLPGEREEHPGAAIEAVFQMVGRMDATHRDPRYFANGNVGTMGQPGKLAQASVGWSGLYSLAAWQLDAVKATRTFRGWKAGGWDVGRNQNKDTLNGREESCLSTPKAKEATEEWAARLGISGKLLRSNDHAGASTVIKRLWHLTWLSKEHPFVPDDFGMPNTRSIATHEPFSKAEDEDDPENLSPSEKYFAILALDGDEMGKWISGVKCPVLSGQVSEEARKYFEVHGNNAFMETRRPLSPSFHLQFSGLLANFAQHCVRRVVEAFDGRLIYAGGDDVLAMVPADTALACAGALRAAFRGEAALPVCAKGIVCRPGRDRREWKSDRETPLFKVSQTGFIQLTPQACPDGYGDRSALLSDPVEFPVMVPGPATDASVGIAIAHFKAPLQDVVRAAHAAEKRAKKKLGRAAVAVSLFKRSGEIIEWGCKWESGGLELYKLIAEAMKKEKLSGKFPHRVVELLTPYLTKRGGLCKAKDADNFNAMEVIKREFGHAIWRQSKPGMSEEMRNALEPALNQHLQNIAKPNGTKEASGARTENQRLLEAIIGLCQTVAFANRTGGND